MQRRYSDSLFHKQKYTQWHNKRRGCKGTLWEELFKSIIIQTDRAREGQWDNALLTMAAYIDLNAVHAGIVVDPKDYRYCCYGEARGLAGRFCVRKPGPASQ